MEPKPPPPPPTHPNAPDMTRMMEAVLTAMQQQNAAIVQQNTVALQQLEVARVSAETSQRQYMDLLASGKATTGPSSSCVHSQEWSLESFLQHHPAKFNGKCSPDEADQWFRDMERIYNAKRCSDENRLAFLEYLLSREASHWWSSTRSLLESTGTQIS